MELVTENLLARVALAPPGLVTTTFQAPAVAVSGIAIWHVIFDAETTVTALATISAEPTRVSLTIAPDWNPVPARFVIAKEEPCAPVLGVIEVTVSDWALPTAKWARPPDEVIWI